MRESTHKQVHNEFYIVDPENLHLSPSIRQVTIFPSTFLFFLGSPS